MTYLDVDSSMIDRVGYDAKSETLEVRFVNTGYSYQYHEVSPETWQKLLAADSKGRFMNAYIIDCYKTTKLKGRRSRAY